MADRPVRPRHRPGAKRIDPEPVEPSASPERPETPEAAEVGVPRQSRPARTPDPSRTWRPHPRDLVPRELRERWDEAQGEFVDDPPGSVRAADALASEVADAVIAEIEARRTALRTALEKADDDTEALRLALRDYRAFVRGLLGDD
ncbi:MULTISPECIES: hypothetical protein [unclassified Nocardiopsis]|uniref:hypothetical protein n=1 Tax=unclassified Nocardiopsis TaxID=2649073 RepID=UPI00066A80A9|nr:MULTISPECIES: hypothetical protein [unclassified Nocardiopsis]MBQ1084243.1 hypothetical protein [Nocardiopsis sp. B62]